MPHPPRAAVVGSGISGLMAAHVLSRTHAVTVFEADERPGGHSHTHDVTIGDTTLRVDSGFIVHNDRTYPTLQRLFRELDVPTQATDMSMSVHHEADRIQYAGGRGVSGILADPRTVARPGYLHMLRDVRRFHRAARTLLDSTPADAAEDVSLGDWLAPQHFSTPFLDWFMRPLVAAVWSCDPDRSLEYPARSLLTFLDHHGMLTVTGSPTWRTVVGGSAVYVDRVLAQIEDVRLSDPVTALRRTASGVEVTSSRGVEAFDVAVVATHPHQALSLLAEPRQAETDVLGAMTYSVNHAQLHTDSSVLPPRSAARGSWNYLLPTDPTTGVLVTYDLTRLMRHPSPGGTRVLVTLNGAHRVDKSKVITEMTYEHPLYTTESLAAQRRLPELSDERIAFAGAYHGWGFHEDGALSGLRAAEALGGHW